MVELRTICSITSGQGAPQDNNEYVNGLHTFIKASDLDTIIKDDSEVNSTKITEQAIKKHNYKIFPKNTIIFAKSGQSCKKNRVYLTKEKSCIVNHLCCLYDIDKKYDPKWLKLFIKSFNVTKLIRDDSYPSIALKDISCIQVPEIEITKQREIVVLIDAMNRLLSNKKEQLKQLDEVVKSRFIEMFDTIDMSEERKDWIELEKISKIYSGTTPSTKDEENWNGDIPWITPAEMNKDTFYITDTVRKITEKGRKSKSLEMMPANTVLLSTRAPIGKVGITGIPMTCNQGFKNFGCGDKLNPIYLYILLKENTEYLNSLGSGTTFLEVSKSKIAKTKIPIPPIELQNTFAEFVKQVDKSKFVNPLSQEFFMRNFYVFIIYHCITKGCINFCMPK